MHFGVQYYPEHWPRERWLIDAQMMQEAGVNTVRMGEFAWSAYEPREEIDFRGWKRPSSCLGNMAFKRFFACSRTPPPWAYLKYPGIVNVNKMASQARRPRGTASVWRMKNLSRFRDGLMNKLSDILLAINMSSPGRLIMKLAQRMTAIAHAAWALFNPISKRNMVPLQR